MDGFIETASVAELMGKKESTIKRWVREFSIPYFPNRGGGYWVPPNTAREISKNLVVPADVREQRREAQKAERLERKRKREEAKKAELRSEIGRKAALKRHGKRATAKQSGTKAKS